MTKYISTIYSFIFYKIYRFYIRNGETDIPGIYSISVIMLLQFFAFIGLIGSFWKLVSTYPGINKYYGGVIGLLLLGWNYWVIYKKVGVKQLIYYWDNKPKEKKRQMNFFMLCHFIISIGLFIVAVIL